MDKISGSIKMLKGIKEMVNLKKSISVITTICFLMTSVFVQGAYAITSPTPMPILGTNALKEMNNYLIPFNIGRITDALYSGKGKVVINIQDLHSHEQTQKNISEILSALDKKYGLDKVYVEGAVGQVNTSWLSSIKDETLKEKIVNNLLASGRLTGSEYYAAETKKDGLLQGIEDKKIYTENLKRLNEIYKNKAEIESYIPHIRYILDKVSQKYYTSENIKLNRVINKNKEGKITAEKYFRYLIKASQRAKIDLRLYKSILNFVEIIEKQRKIDTGKVNKEIKVLLNDLKDKLTYSEYKELTSKVTKKEKETEFYYDLLKVAESKGMIENSKYNNARKFFEYIILNQKLNPIELSRQEKGLITDLNTRFSKTGSEKEIYFLKQYVEEMSGYLNNKLTADEYENFVSNMEYFKMLWKKYVDIDGIIEITKYFELFDEFYKENVQRNKYFVKNIIGQMPKDVEQGIRIKGNINHQEKVLEEIKSGKDISVVITGGFHTYGFSKLLEDEGINYIVITPNITEETDTAEKLYENVFKEQVPVLYQTLQKMLISQTGMGAVLNSDVFEAVGTREDTKVILNEMLKAIGRTEIVKNIEKENNTVKVYIEGQKEAIIIKDTEIVKEDESSLTQEQKQVLKENEIVFEAFKDIENIFREIREKKRSETSFVPIESSNIEELSKTIEKITNPVIKVQFELKLKELKQANRIQISKKIMLMGAPGAGKGTLAQLITDKYQTAEISSGNLLRELAKTDPAIRDTINSGKLVEDDFIIDLVFKKIKQFEDQGFRSFIFDGFPRTAYQAQVMLKFFDEKGWKDDLVFVHLDVPFDTILKRLGGRRTCANEDCGKIWNINVPKLKPEITPEGKLICPECKSAVFTRSDDTPEAITARYETYKEQIMPLLDIYQKNGYTIKNSLLPAEAFNQIKSTLTLPIVSKISKFIAKIFKKDEIFTSKIVAIIEAPLMMILSPEKFVLIHYGKKKSQERIAIENAIKNNDYEYLEQNGYTIRLEGTKQIMKSTQESFTKSVSKLNLAATIIAEVFFLVGIASPIFFLGLIPAVCIGLGIPLFAKALPTNISKHLNYNLKHSLNTKLSLEEPTSVAEKLMKPIENLVGKEYPELIEQTKVDIDRMIETDAFLSDDEKNLGKDEKQQIVESKISKLLNQLEVYLRGNISNTVSERAVSFGTAGFRGIMGEIFDFDGVALIAQSMSNIINNDNSLPKTVFLGNDSRFLGKWYSKVMERVFTANGIEVYSTSSKLGVVATPSIACYLKEVMPGKFAASLNVTASHNPKEYNGVKPNMGDGAPALPAFTKKITEEIQSIKGQIKAGNKGVIKIAAKEKTIELTDIDLKHFKFLDNKLNALIGINREEFAINKATKIGLVVDGKNTALMPVLKQLLNNYGFKNVEIINENRDTAFGGIVSPEPNGANTKDLQKKVLEGSLGEIVFGIATDPDGDRFCIYDTDGTFISPNEVGLMVADKLLSNLMTELKKNNQEKKLNIEEVNKYRAVMVKSLVTTFELDLLAEYYSKEFMEIVFGANEKGKEEYINKYGNPISVLTVSVGWKNIADGQKSIESKGERYLLGVESSGGLSVGLYDKDGGLATVMPVLIAAQEGKTFKELLSDARTRTKYKSEFKETAVKFPKEVEATVEKNTKDIMNVEIIGSESDGDEQVNVTSKNTQVDKRELVVDSLARIELTTKDDKWFESATMADKIKEIATVRQKSLLEWIKTTNATKLDELLKNLGMSKELKVVGVNILPNEGVQISIADESYKEGDTIKRLLTFRASGTEPLVRVYAETTDANLTNTLSSIGENIVKGAFKSFENLPEYIALEEYIKNNLQSIKILFAQDINKEDADKRGNKFSRKIDLGNGHYLIFDGSRTNIDEKIKVLLINLLKARDVKNKIADMFNGKKINWTEARAVLHTALRNTSNKPVYVEGIDKNVMEDINKVLQKMKSFSDKIISGDWKGVTGKQITDIVSIGIGGSDLGPRMATEALSQFKIGPNVHFVSNVDPNDINSTLNSLGLNPETTLFIIESKTFTTEETITNANLAKKWIKSKLGDNADVISKHFVAVSTNKEKVAEFGIDTNNMFEFWDWVGGRYSVWSAVGLPLMCSVGYDNFAEFLDGAHKIDNHFKNVSYENNIPILMAMLNILERNFLDRSAYTILPYNEYLKLFTSHIQQVYMESLGKSVDSKGNRIKYATGSEVYGTPGTNAQHSYLQLHHQGTDIVPMDFIGFINNGTEDKDMQKSQVRLLANLLAQSNAMAFGRTYDETVKSLISEGLDENTAKKKAKDKIFDGNRPSTILLFDKLTPRTLGALIALYEDMVATLGIVWDINTFDQMGVELGKTNAKGIFGALEGKNFTTDSSTQKLIQEIKEVIAKTIFPVTRVISEELMQILSVDKEIYSLFNSLSDSAIDTELKEDTLKMIESEFPVESIKKLLKQYISLRNGNLPDILDVMPDNIKFGTAGVREQMNSKFDFIVVAILTQAISNAIKSIAEIQEIKEKDIKILVGGDSRFMSKQFAEIVSKIFAANGIKVVVSSEDVPSPTISYITKNQGFTLSVNITASHNPKEYNGLKITLGDGGQASKNVSNMIEKEITDLMNKLKAGTNPKGLIHIVKESEKIENIDMQKDFIVAFKKMIYEIGGITDDESLESFKDKASGWTIIVDPKNGATKEYYPKVLKDLGFNVVMMNDKRDVTFSGQKPEPIAVNMTQLIKMVKDKSEGGIVNLLGISTDVDGDRFGIVDKKGRFITANEVGLILEQQRLKIELNKLIDKVISGEISIEKFINKKIIIARTIATTHAINDLAKYMSNEIFIKRFNELQKIATKNGISLDINDLINNIQVKEVNVGFKNMAELKHKTEKEGNIFLLAVESSGGISIAEWIYDKCGFLANIMVLMTLVNTQKQAMEIVDDIYGNIGYTSTFMETAVKFNSIVKEEQPNLSENEINQEANNRKISFKNWAETATIDDAKKLFAEVEGIQVTDIDQTGEVNESGKMGFENLRILFSDNYSWVVLRLSGTEPAVRVYVETQDKQLSEKLSKIGEEIVKGKFKLLQPSGKYSKEEITDYRNGKAKNKNILNLILQYSKLIKPLQEQDMIDLTTLPQEEQLRLERKGLMALLNGEVGISMLMAGSSSRMNVQEAPEELKELISKVKSMKSKAAVPIDEYKGLVITYLGAFGTNVARFFEQIETEARKAGIPNPERIWENFITLLTNDEYMSEHQQMLDDNNYYGLKKKENVHFITQPLGVKYHATVEDVRKIKNKFKTEAEYYQALIFAAQKEEEIKINPEKAIYEGEIGGAGHGEFHMQMLYSGELRNYMKAGKKYVTIKSIDNYAGKYDKNFVMELGYCIDKEVDVVAEASETTPGRSGGHGYAIKDINAIIESPIAKALKSEGANIGKEEPKIFSNALSFQTIEHEISLYKKKGQSTEDFTAEYDQALEEKAKGNLGPIAALAQRGRDKFPVFIDPKLAKNITEYIVPKDLTKYNGVLTQQEKEKISQFAGNKVNIHTGVFTIETNAWSSTIASLSKVLFVKVNGGNDIDINAYQKMTWEEKKAVLKQLRAFSTKSWDKTIEEKQAILDFKNKLSGAKEGDDEYISNYNDPRVTIGLDTYQGNKIIASDMLKYLMEENLITENIFTDGWKVYASSEIPRLFKQAIMNSIESLQRIVLSIIYRDNMTYTIVTRLTDENYLERKARAEILSRKGIKVNLVLLGNSKIVRETTERFSTADNRLIFGLLEKVNDKLMVYGYEQISKQSIGEEQPISEQEALIAIFKHLNANSTPDLLKILDLSSQTKDISISDIEEKAKQMFTTIGVDKTTINLFADALKQKINKTNNMFIKPSVVASNITSEQIDAYGQADISRDLEHGITTIIVSIDDHILVNKNQAINNLLQIAHKNGLKVMFSYTINLETEGVDKTLKWIGQLNKQLSVFRSSGGIDGIKLDLSKNGALASSFVMVSLLSRLAKVVNEQNIDSFLAVKMPIDVPTVGYRAIFKENKIKLVVDYNSNFSKKELASVEPENIIIDITTDENRIINQKKLVDIFENIQISMIALDSSILEAMETPDGSFSFREMTIGKLITSIFETTPEGQTIKGINKGRMFMSDRDIKLNGSQLQELYNMYIETDINIEKLNNLLSTTFKQNISKNELQGIVMGILEVAELNNLNMPNLKFDNAQSVNLLMKTLIDYRVENKEGISFKYDSKINIEDVLKANMFREEYRTQINDIFNILNGKYKYKEDTVIGMLSSLSDDSSLNKGERTIVLEAILLILLGYAQQETINLSTESINDVDNIKAILSAA